MAGPGRITAKRTRPGDPILCLCPASRNVGFTDAGWSSSVARWAHNPEVAGSNPAPATNVTKAFVHRTSALIAVQGLPADGPANGPAVLLRFMVVTGVPVAVCVAGSWWSLGFRFLGDSVGTRFR